MNCGVVKYSTGYGWFANEYRNINQTCILAIHFDREINMGSLLNYRKHGLISLADYGAIRRFDFNKGTKRDLKQIKNLAKHLGNISIVETSI